ncbi:hypothetical protein PGT21_025934 [Puccinia graminis f. sp. tritici]|uniref:Uncharacterized protein n=1 Tax=Puccinia graminis f. sp. tritici TaxID=56615 RepID=A0A5B0Q6Y4_PUCGR|nr:hypothetical protein PGT21_025934 [Puccinia graminis f. sp. tritici]
MARCLPKSTMGPAQFLVRFCAPRYPGAHDKQTLSFGAEGGTEKDEARSAATSTGTEDVRICVEEAGSPGPRWGMRAVAVGDNTPPKVMPTGADVQQDMALQPLCTTRIILGVW